MTLYKMRNIHFHNHQYNSIDMFRCNFPNNYYHIRKSMLHRMFLYRKIHNIRNNHLYNNRQESLLQIQQLLQ